MRVLYTSVAALALTASGALAQEAGNSSSKSSTDYQASAKADGMMQHGLRASDVIGKPIYVTEAKMDGAQIDVDAIEWDRVGDVNDIVMSTDGGVQGVLLDIGGFLGMGERTVMIPASDLKFVSGMNDGEEFYIVFPGTEADFEGMEEFDTAAVYNWAADVEEDVEQAAAEVEAETEEAAAAAGAAAEEVETDVEQAAAEVEAETEEAAAAADAAAEEVETDVEQAAAEVEAETEEAAAAADAAAEEVETDVEQAAAEVEAETEQAEAALEGEQTTDGETTAATASSMTSGETEQTADGEQTAQSEGISQETRDIYAAPAPDIALEGWERLELAEVTTEDLTGATVLDANMEDIGTVSELFVGMDGSLTEAELSVGGLIWGIGATDVRVSMDSLNIQQDLEAGEIHVYVDLTEEALMEREAGE